MSGIFGIAAKHASASLHTLQEANAMYGAEGSGTWTGADYAIGCHLEHFAQSFPCSAPILQDNGSCAVIDALLYNREELLPLAGLPDSTPDETLLLRLIQEKGPDILRMVNGDFAGAVYDPQKQKWLFFRDQTGIRPLYIYCKDAVLAFSTEIRGLLKLQDVDLSVDEKQLYIMLMGGNTNTAHATEFAHIRMLAAGHYAWVCKHENGFEWDQIAYYIPGKQKIRRCSDRAYEKQLYELVQDAVRRRLQAVPGLVGAELSGGLDSGVIDVFINRESREARYFSWSPPIEEHPLQKEDERLLIDLLCRQENIKCNFLPIDTSSRMTLFTRQLPPHAHTLQVGDTAAWMARQGVRAVFSGHGGDEGASHRMHILELWHHKEFIAYAQELYHQLKGRNLRLARVAVRMLRQFRAGTDYNQSWWGTGGNNRNLLADAFLEKMQNTPLPPMSFAYAPEDFVAAGGQRCRVDNAAFQAAEHGVRYLFPLMDHRVMSFALGIPRRLYMKRGQTRLIYRKAFASILPKEICQLPRKDSPGIYTIEIPGTQEDYDRSLRHLLDQLDLERWGQYWNRSMLESIKETIGTQACPLGHYHVNALYICWLIQQWQDGRWKDAQNQDVAASAVDTQTDAG